MMAFTLRNTILGLFVLGLSSSPASALDLEKEQDRIGYSVGYQVGSDFRLQDIELDTAAMVKGFEDALADRKPQLSPEELQKTLIALKRNIVERHEQIEKQARAGHLAAGQAFLAANGDKEGVVSLPSGLQYKVIAAGTGGSPGKKDTVKVNYRARFLDGSEFDSSFKKGEPAIFRLDSVIAGLSEGLQLMKTGSRFELFLPPSLAFGEKGPLADRTIVFDLELLEIVADDET